MIGRSLLNRRFHKDDMRAAVANKKSPDLSKRDFSKGGGADSKLSSQYRRVVSAVNKQPALNSDVQDASPLDEFIAGVLASNSAFQAHRGTPSLVLSTEPVVITGQDSLHSQENGVPGGNTLLRVQRQGEGIKFDYDIPIDLLGLVIPIPRRQEYIPGEANKTESSSGLDFDEEKVQEEEVLGESSYALQKHRKIHQVPAMDKVVNDIEGLYSKELDIFYNWRRSLHLMEEKTGFAMTPYEKNIEVWRQLWRVVERSDIIVEVLDGRNPVLFHSKDLVAYVESFVSRKQIVVLINKADYLNASLKRMWRNYFEKQGIRVYFFSALWELIRQGKVEIEDKVQEIVGGFRDESVHTKVFCLVCGYFHQIKNEKSIEISSNTSHIHSMRHREDELPGTLCNAVTESNHEDKEKLDTSCVCEKNDGSDIEYKPDDELSRDNGIDDEKNPNIASYSTNDASNPIFDVPPTLNARDFLSEIQSVACELLSDEQPRSIGGFSNPRRDEILLKIDENMQERSGVSSSQSHSEERLASHQEVRFVLGLVGFPNVGKSSVINSLLGAKRVAVSRQPGKTKHFQSFQLPDYPNITLCDCPGLVFPSIISSKYHLLINGIISIDHFRGSFLPAIQLIVDRIPLKVLERYGLQFADCVNKDKQKLLESALPSVISSKHHTITGSKLDAAATLVALATRRKFYSGGRGGLFDLFRAAKLIISDFCSGRLVFCQAPPLEADTEIKDCTDVAQDEDCSDTPTVGSQRREATSNTEDTVEIDANKHTAHRGLVDPKQGTAAAAAVFDDLDVFLMQQDKSVKEVVLTARALRKKRNDLNKGRSMKFSVGS